MPSTLTSCAVIGENSDRVESSAARWNTVSTSNSASMRSSALRSRIERDHLALARAGLRGLERRDVEGDDRSGAVVGEPIDQAVADFARRASNENNGFAHGSSVKTGASRDTR